MQTIQQQFSVTFQYQVSFTRGIFDVNNTLLADLIKASGKPFPKKILPVIDSGVISHHPQIKDRLYNYCHHLHEYVDTVTDAIIIEGGEAAKENIEYVTHIHEEINRSGIDRHSFVMAIGGGAVIDLVGFAASVAHRGIRLIRIPTTVLSQNDAAIGVKNGINRFGKKNFLGSFTPPFAVINDFDFLETLDDRDWRSGIAEAVKVALLKDPELFCYLEDNIEALNRRENHAIEYVIYQCARLHLDHIANSGDPFENGSSRPLDFGHWSAHRLESLSDYKIRHGEAVAIGIVLDATYSHLLGLLDRESLQRILDLFVALGFRVYTEELVQHIDEKNHPRNILNGLEEFREHLGGSLTIMLLKNIGEGVETNAMDPDIIRESINRLKTYVVETHR